MVSPRATLSSEQTLKPPPASPGERLVLEAALGAVVLGLLWRMVRLVWTTEEASMAEEVVSEA